MILHKPAALTDEEWQFMRRHTIIGEPILQAAPAIVGVAHLVARRTSGGTAVAIPTASPARTFHSGSGIVFVCDAFHAMTTSRLYSPARSLEAALSDLDRRAGTQFDPAVSRRSSRRSTA